MSRLWSFFRRNDLAIIIMTLAVWVGVLAARDGFNYVVSLLVVAVFFVALLCAVELAVIAFYKVRSERMSYKRRKEFLDRFYGEG